MKLVAVQGAQITCVPPGEVIATYITNPNMTIDNKPVCHSIVFTYTNEEGFAGGGTFQGTSVSATCDYQSFVLQGDFVEFTATQPPPSGATTPVIATISSAGQTSTFAE